MTTAALPTVPYVAFVVLIACICSILHRSHLAFMFENDRHFSHLSTLEREMTFRSEMGLYYSYYKTLVESSNFFDGLYSITHDNVTEFPSTINTLNRFNLFPEVFIAGGFRLVMNLMSYFELPTKQCWRVQRGQGLAPVLSCEGIGEPAYFYIECVFQLNGLLVGLLFVFGTFLSGTIVGGTLTVLSFLYNHGECTRVMWTPPLRESFAYPFLMLQMLIVTIVIRCKKPGILSSIFIAISTVGFMLPWQFAQFALFTQTLASYGTYLLNYIDSQKLRVIVVGQLIGCLTSLLLQFGNTMILSSFFLSGCFTVLILLKLENQFKRIKFRLLSRAFQVLLLLIGTFAIKNFTAFALNTSDDAHIGDILRSKFSDFRTFHTMLYTCATEYNFLEFETIIATSKTLLLPCTVVVLSAMAFEIIRDGGIWGDVPVEVVECSKERSRSRNKKNAKSSLLNDDSSRAKCTTSNPSDQKQKSDKFAEVVYHSLQMAAFAILALLIMRLKLFWIPHMSIIVSLMASPLIFGWVGSRGTRYSIICVLCAIMSVQGISNLQHQWNIIGEFSNIEMERLMDWINNKTTHDDWIHEKGGFHERLHSSFYWLSLDDVFDNNSVFAGSMPTMATVKLCTGRPIVNHPHYENVDLRERTKMVYTLFSRKNESEVWTNLMKLEVDYVINEQSWCLGQSKLGCGLAEIWDMEDSENRGKSRVCERLYSDPSPYFERVYRNRAYDVLKLVKDLT